jgi:hypothetical protein
MARATIDQIRSITDFQKQYMWQVSILRQPAVAPIDPTRFDLQMMSTDVPHRTGETSTLMMRGFQIFDPGIYKVGGTINLAFVETVDNFVKNFISDWEDALYLKSSSFGDLTADFCLTMMDNQEQPIYSYDLLYCFLEDSNIPTLEGSSNDPMQPTITLKYTDMRRHTLA